MKAKVLILTEGGSRIGFGHITRCSALYEALRERAVEAALVINGDRTVKAFLKGKKYKVLDWLKDQSGLSEVLSGADAVVIDSYLAERELYKKITGRVRNAVFIDDNNRIKYPAGTVVNGSPYAETLNYPKVERVKYLLGTRYLPLRKEFWRISARKPRKKISTVLVTFGGDDLQNMTPRVLDILASAFPQFKKKVIVGRGFSNLHQINKATDSNTELVFYPDAKKMRDAMASSDIAVSAAGQSLYELARLGIPTVAVVVAKNQFNNIKGWKRAGFACSAGWCKDKDISSYIIRCIKKLESRDARARKSAIGRKMIDGRAAERISGYIKGLLGKCGAGGDGIRLRHASRGDSREIWSWRNCKEARKASVNKDRIPWSKHEKWFDSKMSDGNARIYIAEAGAKKLGVVRFEPKGRRFCASISLNPAHFGKGYGSRIIRLGSKKFMSEKRWTGQIIAEIKKDNLASQKAFVRAGYKLTGTAGRLLTYTIGDAHVR